MRRFARPLGASIGPSSKLSPCCFPLRPDSGRPRGQRARATRARASAAALQTISLLSATRACRSGRTRRRRAPGPGVRGRSTLGSAGARIRPRRRRARCSRRASTRSLATRRTRTSPGASGRAPRTTPCARRWRSSGPRTGSSSPSASSSIAGRTSSVSTAGKRCVRRARVACAVERPFLFDAPSPVRGSRPSAPASAEGGAGASSWRP